MSKKLDLILNEVVALRDRMDKREAKEDARFELIKEEIGGLREETTSIRQELRAETASIRQEMRQGFAKVDEQFREVRKDLTVIRNQTAHLTERVTVLENKQVAQNN